MALAKKIIGSALIASSLALAGCGTASNDQGISFTLLGFTALTGDSTSNTRECTLDTFDNVLSIPIGETSESNNSGVETNRCLLVQNNMIRVGVRTERVNLNYYIPGATEQPPSTSVPMTVFVGAATGTDAPSQGGVDEEATTTSAGVLLVGNRTAAPVNIVPPEIRSWISLNRGSLPEAPFSLEISADVVAVTTAGDLLETNTAYYQAQIVNDLIINPNAGGGDTTGTTDTITEPLTEGTDGVIE